MQLFFNSTNTKLWMNYHQLHIYRVWEYLDNYISNTLLFKKKINWHYLRKSTESIQLLLKTLKDKHMILTESHLHISAPIPLPNKSHLPPFPIGQQNIENPLAPVRWVSPFSFAVHCTSFLLFWPEPHRPDLSLADLRLFYEHWFFLLKLTPIPTIFLLSSPSWSTKEWLKDYFFTLYNW